jgi:hypothetical protein
MQSNQTMNYNNTTKPCDELARALVDVVPEDLAVLTIRRSSANNARVSISLDVDAARVAIARWLGVADEIGVWLTACGKTTWFVRARGAHRLADADWASVLRGVDGGAQWQMRSPHGIVVGRVDRGEFGDANVAKWRWVLQDDAAIPRVPLAMPMLCRCHQSFFFVDKHAATRVLTAAFGAQVPTKVAVDGVQYSVTHNWRPAARLAAAGDGAQQQAAAPAPPSPAPLVRQAPPTVTQPIRRAVVFHDAENCWIGPMASGVEVYRRMVAHVRACVGGGSGDMRVEWNLVLRAKGCAPSDAQYRPARHTVEDLRDLGVTMIDAGQKDGAVDATVKELMRQWLASWSDLTAAAQQTTVVVLISGDRDFAPSCGRCSRPAAGERRQCARLAGESGVAAQCALDTDRKLNHKFETMNQLFRSHDDYLGAPSTHSSTIDHDDDGSDFACLGNSVDNVHVRTLSDSSNAAANALSFE